jgi:arabinose-5-phosphate isomerase
MATSYPTDGRTPPPDAVDPAMIDRGRQVIRIEAAALDRLADTLDQAFAAAVRMIINARRRVVVTGMGKSGHVARKIVATLAATGTPAMFLHPAEAAHGDLGMVTPGDVLIALSNSGSTPEVQLIMRYAQSLGCRSIAISGRAHAPIMQAADIALLLPPAREACPVNIAPTTSTTMMIALGDALAVTVMGLRGISRERIKLLHPGGSIGASLTPVDDLMHTGEWLPLVPADAPMRDVLVVMTEKSLGLAGVIDTSGHLVGVITDGDLRRHIDTLMESVARDVMTPDPRTITLGSFAGDARALLAQARITALFVVARDDPQRPVGVVHIHDLARCDIAITAEPPYRVTPDRDTPDRDTPDRDTP